jgi:hypothetical protein
MYEHLKQKGLGGFSNTNHWFSSLSFSGFVWKAAVHGRAAGW